MCFLEIATPNSFVSKVGALQFIGLSQVSYLDACYRWYSFRHAQKENLSGVPVYIVYSELKTTQDSMEVSLKWGFPEIIHLNRIFYDKPSILEIPYSWKPAFMILKHGSITDWWFGTFFFHSVGNDHPN